MDVQSDLPCRESKAFMSIATRKVGLSVSFCCYVNCNRFVRSCELCVQSSILKRLAMLSKYFKNYRDIIRRIGMLLVW